MANETIATVVVPANSIANWGMHINDVGGLTGAIVGAIIIFGYVISKFKKDTTVNASEANLYKNLSDRIEVISATLIKAEADREVLRAKLLAADIRLSNLERLEKENELLRKRLIEKDIIIDTMQKASDAKFAEVADLQKRIHDLELTMQHRLLECEICDHKRLAQARTRASDESIQWVPPANDTNE